VSSVANILQFDGTENAYITTSNPFTTWQQISVATWFRIRGSLRSGTKVLSLSSNLAVLDVNDTTSHFLFHMGNVTSFQMGLAIEGQTGLPQFVFGTTRATAGAAALTLGVWHHIVAVFVIQHNVIPYCEPCGP
jgi:hypothetical protein